MLGYKDASENTQYLLYSLNGTQYAVISNFDNQFLTVQLDNTKHHIKNQVKIIQVSDDKTFSVQNNMHLDIPQQNILLYFIYKKFLAQK